MGGPTPRSTTNQVNTSGLRVAQGKVQVGGKEKNGKDEEGNKHQKSTGRGPKTGDRIQPVAPVLEVPTEEEQKCALVIKKEE